MQKASAKTSLETLISIRNTVFGFFTAAVSHRLVSSLSGYISENKYVHLFYLTEEMLVTMNTFLYV